MKRLFIVFALVCVAALIARVETPVQGQGQGQGSRDSSEINAGVGAVPPEITLDLSGKNRSLVCEGSYYVNGISDCVGCHNGPEGDDPANPIPLEDRYLAGGQDFGPVFTRNLTPDSTGNPAGLTFPEFLAVIRVGRDWKNLPPAVGDPDTLIIMPWPAYRHGTDRFIRAIYEYLRSIPCLPGGPAPDSATRCE
jgi:hypothetical protein